MMNNNQLKAALMGFLKLIKNEIAIFEQGLTEKQKEEKGSLEKWSAKDTLSHLVFWGDHFNSQTEKAKSGEKVPMAGDYFDQVNDGVLIEHMEQSFSEALIELERSFENSIEILKSFSADELNDKENFEHLNGRTLMDHALGTLGWHITHHISDFYIKNGRTEKAIVLQEKYTIKLRDFPTWEANAIYNLACFFAQIGNKEKAINNLKTAFIIRPDLIEWAKNDSDLEPLRKDLDFKALFPAS